MWIATFPLLVLSALFFSPIIVHADLTTGLVGYWTFNGKDTNWGTNTTQDKSGQGNTGTLIGMSTTTSPVAGKIGQGLNSISSTGYIALGTPSSLSISGSITISAWIYPRSKYDGIFRKTDDITGFNFRLYDQTDRNLLFGRSGVNVFSNAGAITLNKWQFVTVTNDGVNTKFYVNGVDVGTTAQSGIVASPGVTANIGYAGDGTAYRALDDVRIYNRALSAQEVKLLYNTSSSFHIASSPTNVLTNGLVGYWTFDGKNMPSGNVNDVSGQGNHMSITNGASVSFATSTGYVAGKIGQAHRMFKTSGSYYTKGSTSAFNFTSSDFSGFMWVKYTSHNINSESYMGNGGYQANGWQLTWFETTSQMLFRTNQAGADQGTYSTTNPIQANKWHLVGFTRSGTTAKIYVDGVDVTGTPASHINPTSSSNAFGIGVYTPIPNSYLFDGKIDDVRVYNRALSAQEVKLLYNLGSAKLAVSPDMSMLSGTQTHWSFDGKSIDWNINQASDSSNNASTNDVGILTNMSTTSSPVAGKIGQALKFDGVDDMVTAPSAGLPSNASAGTAYTICAWFKPYRVHDGVIFSYMRTASSQIFALILGNDGKIGAQAKGVSGTPVASASSTTLYIPNIWYHACGIKIQLTSQSIYINGVFEAIESTSIGLSTVSVLRAGFGLTGSSFFNGEIDDIRMFSRALSPTEIKQLYNLGFSRPR